MVTPVVGIKRIGNGYRRAAGDGWALVGDALHYKDPVDGQGIYDALLEARLLDEALGAWHAGTRPWSEAMAGYQRAARDATWGMYRETITRLRRELYEEPPTVVARTLVRWMVTDPAYQLRFLQFLCRAIPPEGWLSRRLMGGAVVRGIARDLRGLLRRAPA
jgi:2-polyprenyl-6-methoxyphenol hydroxylase-like FAD-dependent oxidoreductase